MHTDLKAALSSARYLSSHVLYVEMSLVTKRAIVVDLREVLKKNFFDKRFLLQALWLRVVFCKILLCLLALSAPQFNVSETG